MKDKLKAQITINVSAHLPNGKFINEESLKTVIWQIKNIGGEFISSNYIRPSLLSQQPYFEAVFEFESKEESPFIPLNFKHINS